MGDTHPASCSVRRRRRRRGKVARGGTVFPFLICENTQCDGLGVPRAKPRNALLSSSCTSCKLVSKMEGKANWMAHRGTGQAWSSTGGWLYARCEQMRQGESTMVVAVSDSRERIAAWGYDFYCVRVRTTNSPSVRRKNWTKKSNSLTLFVPTFDPWSV